MMEQVNVKLLLQKNDKLICAHCGRFTGTKCRYICRACRKKMKMQGAADVYRYFLVRHLLELVKSYAPDKHADGAE